MYLYSFLLCILSGFNFACTAESKNQPEQITVSDPDTLIQFSIGAVGDLMCHSTQYNLAKVGTDSFNFDRSFAYIKPYISDVDLALGNLETTLRGTDIPYSGYPQFNTPDAYATAIKNAGFDCVVTANNHSNDTGEKGIIRTIQILEENGLAHTGSFTSANKRDSVVIFDVQGVKVGLVAYTYSTNGLPLADGKPWLVNLCDSALIAKDIASGRKNGAELMIVFYHFGQEYERMPNTYQKQFVQWAIDNGADIVFGSHPHVVQPAGFYPASGKGNTDSVFVAWSMGNFISNQQDAFTDEGMFIRLSLEKNTRSGKVRFTNAECIPTWVYKGKLEELKIHTVFPIIDSNYTGIPDFVFENYADELKDAAKHTPETWNKKVTLE